MNANMTAPRCLVAAIDADLRFGLTSRSRENGCNSVSSGTRSRPGSSLSGPPRFVPGGPFESCEHQPKSHASLDPEA
jgi:hypothetical protein